MHSPLLELKKISKTYPGVRALREVDFELQPGEVHALLGENGAGKSTLIRIITGLVAPDRGGEFRVAGRSITDPSPHRMQALGLAAVYQNPTLFHELSVAENLDLGEGGPVINWRARRAAARARLDRIGVTLDLDAPVKTLRMAEKQLLEIARALGRQARVLILDEPTASLAQHDADRLLAILEKLRAGGTGILYVSHRLEEVLRLADRVTVLRDGAGLGTHWKNGVDRPRLIRLMAGRDLAELYPKTAVPPGEVVLAVRGLGHAPSGIHDISLEVRAGEILGLAGLVGAGRTELARTLFGLTPATAGEIFLDGKPAAIRSVAHAVARRLAYVPEDRPEHGVVGDLSVAENISLAVLRRLNGGWLDEAKEAALAAGFCRRLGVKTPSLFAPARLLSGGNQQKVALARWLATEPRILILDEPTQGIDVASKAEIHRLMGRLAQQGLAIILISSELPELLGLADRIAVMRRGRLAGVLPASGATREAVLHLAMAEEAAPPSEAVPDSRATPSATEGPLGFLKTHGQDARATRLRQGYGGQAWHGRPAHVRKLKCLRTAAFDRRELVLFSAIVALFALPLFGVPGFYAAGNLRNLVMDNLPVLVAAMGMTVVIVAGQIDISIGSQFVVCGVLAGLAAKAGASLPVVIFATICAGTALGLLNGLLVAWAGIPAIIATLATMAVLRHAVICATGGDWIQNLPAGFQWFGLGQGAAPPLYFAAAAALFCAAAWALRSTAAVRAFYAVGCPSATSSGPGCDHEAARRVGLNPPAFVLGAFVLMGAFTAVAALLGFTRYPTIETNAGLGLELKVIAAVVVGGASITGGRGSLTGTLLGVILLGAIGTVFTFLHLDPAWEKAIQGAIILAAVVSDTARRKGGGGD